MKLPLPSSTIEGCMKEPRMAADSPGIKRLKERAKLEPAMDGYLRQLESDRAYAAAVERINTEQENE